MIERSSCRSTASRWKSIGQESLPSSSIPLWLSYPRQITFLPGSDARRWLAPRGHRCQGRERTGGRDRAGSASRIRVPIGDLIRLDPRTDAVVYLSDRKVDAQENSGYFGPTRPLRVDRTVDGHGFQLGGHTYDRGLGTQSQTLLAYRLKPGDRRFQALVGVDDRAGPLGSVVFRVLTDRKPRVTTPPMTLERRSACDRHRHLRSQAAHPDHRVW